MTAEKPTPSRLDPSFLRAVVLLCGFKPEPMRRAQAALLYLGLASADFTAAEIPAELTNDNMHVAGCATGALVSEEILVVVGRVKSPKPDAKGRKLNLLRLPNAKRATAKAWLRANGFPQPSESDCADFAQLNLGLTTDIHGGKAA